MTTYIQDNSVQVQAPSGLGFTMSTVPAPPIDAEGRGYHVDLMRWMIAVADTDWQLMAFVSILLSHYSKYGELSERQAASFDKVWLRFHQTYHAGGLDCQIEPDG